MSQGPCRLTLWQHGVGEAADGNETFTSSKGVDHNDHASAYSTSGNCTNTSWGVFFHNPPEQGSGIVIGKGDAAGGPLWNTHGEGKGSLNHRFYKIDDEISFVKKIEFPQIPEGAILENVDVYGRRADGRQGEWGHYPFVDSLDLANPNHTQQLLVHAGVGGSPEIKGAPCPGGAGIPIGHRTYRCMYKDNNEIQGLYSGISNEPADPRRDLYGRVVKKYCENNENISKSVGGGLTCEDFGASRETWCSQDERIKTEPSCSKDLIGKTLYHKVASAYCDANPTDEWCKCYNLVNKVCTKTDPPQNSEAAGCKHAYGIIETNKKAFGPAVQIQSAEKDVEKLKEGTDEHKKAVEKLNELKKKDGYPILVENVHCRPDACNSMVGGGYIPENPKGSCAASYNFCDQDINIKSMSNMDIVLACNTGFPYSKPDWWDDPIVPFKLRRKFPYNKFPLNKTPMFKVPNFKRFSMRNKNDKYHLYTGVGSIALCCCCLIMMLAMSRMRRR